MNIQNAFDERASNGVVKAEKPERGASLVEYALLVALIAIICIVAVRTLGRKASQNFSKASSNL